MRAVVLRSALATLSDEQLITEQINSCVSQLGSRARCLSYTRHQTRQALDGATLVEHDHLPSKCYESVILEPTLIDSLDSRALTVAGS